jgi:predicted heme/steroid binding protein
MLQKIITKIDRISAWILFVGMILYFISGYGMTKGFISPAMAADLHLSYLTYVVMIGFVLHTYYAIHLAFKRWSIWNIYTKLLLLLFYLFFLLGFVYVDRYYSVEKATAEGQAEISSMDTNKTISEDEADDDEVGQSSQSSSGSSSVSTPSATPTAKTFTLAQLAQYNGLNGQPAYVAVDGDVYDLTSIFQQGKHFSHYAGTELTNAFYSYHAKRSLAKYPIVGTLAK